MGTFYEKRFSVPKSKYHANKVETVEGRFDSQKELMRWMQLKKLQAEGHISDLKRQVRYELIPAQKVDGKTVEKKCVYVADFVYKDPDGKTVVEDAKGYRTDTYIVKRKLMLYVHGIRIKEI